MRIKSLELIGFKSFVDRTVIAFENGITGIVGPNGAGKSNCVDAIRWVMGEQSAKHLRGDAMQDIIFSGSAHRAPLGMASVFLTFDNSDGRAPAEYANYSEITVGRRLYRSGESEYYINRTPCRLKDVIDLFLGTGTGTKAYSIVEQGRIGQIITAKPEERRYFIEEAAGISKFKYRKEAALRKMEATKGNLLRLQDIVNELERQLHSLSRQAKKAERYREYAEELRAAELATAAHQWMTGKGELDQAEATLAVEAERETSAAAAVAALEAALESGRTELAAIERTITALQDQAYALQNAIHLHEGELQTATQEIAEIAVRERAHAKAIEDLTTQRAQWQTELTTANAAKVDADVALAAAGEQVALIEGRIGACTTRADDLRRELEQLQGAVVRAVQCVSEGRARVETLERGVRAAEEELTRERTAAAAGDREIAALRARLAKAEGEVASRKQLQLHLAGEREAMEAELTRQQGLLATAEEEQARCKEIVQERRARFTTLQELRQSFAHYDAGVRAVLQTQQAGVVGTVAECLTAEPRFEAAIGAVLGERLQSVVVESHAAGVAAIDYLKGAAAGRSTFIPLHVRSEESAGTYPQGDGVIGPLHDFVRWTDAFHPIGRYLFQNVVVVEDLATALHLWNRNGHRATLVTLDGEVLDPAGVLSGGVKGAAATRVLAERRELEALQAEVALRATELAVTERRVTELAERVAACETEMHALTHDAHAEELQLVHQGREVEHLETELARRSAEWERIGRTIEVVAAELRALGDSLTTARAAAAAAAAEQARCDEALQRARTDEAGAREELAAGNADLLRWQSDRAAREERVRGIDREIARVLAARAEAAGAIACRQAEIADGARVAAERRQTMEGRRTQLSRAVTEAAAVKARQQAAQGEFQERLETIRTKEGGLRDIRKHYEAARDVRHAAALQSTQQRERLGYLQRDIQEKYRVAIADAPTQYLPDAFDPAAAAAQVEALREKVEGLGSVNTDAVQEYEELKSRHDFLTQQAADLTASLEALQRAIQKINRITRERFREAFAAINTRFQQLFPKLFKGGRAELVLTDAENLLESGVEIVAQPPGKKLQGVTLLSGGEKALTAVALIFAMFLTRPSPFCLLDEVDAPLDDANIDRFNEMIREMTAYSQFILITHNKRTMELADTLYGVTMEEPGVSKLISVRLHHGDAEPASAAA